jgi:hypothetical protein
VSLILDALNRSRQEQDGRDVPGLSTEHYQPASEDPKFTVGRWLPWLGLGLSLLVILWLVLEPEPEAVVTPGTPPVAPGVPSPAPTVPVEVAPAPEVAKPEPVSEQLQDPAVAALYEQGSTEPVSVEVPEPEEVKPEPIAESEPGTVAQKQADERPVDIETMVRNAQRELEQSRLAEHAAPFISKLSQQTKDQIPTIYYQRHDYSVGGAAASVVLNGKTLRVGGQAASGVKVDEILSDSVVLNHKGTQFRLKALNSWVNL